MATDFIEYAGVIPEWSYELYRSFKAGDSSLHTLRFGLTQEAFLQIKGTLHIRIRYPDGTTENHLVRPVCADSALLQYHAETPVSSTPSNKGTCYAEISHNGTIVGAVVFSTDGPNEYGRWEGDELLPLQHYTPENATDRLNATLRHTPVGPFPGTDIFEEAIKRFISDTDN